MSSGSKKRPTAPELLDWQRDALAQVARLPIASEVVFGGGAALAALHLHHRTSADLDFFLERELEPAELQPLSRSLKRAGASIEQETVGPRRTLVLLRDGAEFGRIDFAFYPFDPVGRRAAWNGLRVESLIDMTVNKVQAVLTRFQPRDFVDLYFLLREGPERDLDRLLDLVRAKFDVGADRLALARRLLLVLDVVELPNLLRPVSIAKNSATPARRFGFSLALMGSSLAAPHTAVSIISSTIQLAVQIVEVDHEGETDGRARRPAPPESVTLQSPRMSLFRWSGCPSVVRRALAWLPVIR